MAKKILWGIHGGQGGEADRLFMEKSVIAIGWSEMGDLSGLKDRAAFKAKYREVYPEAKPGLVANHAGQMFRFVREIEVGHHVVYSAPARRKFHIGRVTGDYVYRPEVDQHYCNQRPVEWLRDFPRTDFSPGARFELGSAMTLFRVKTHANEFVAALEGKPPKQPPEGAAVTANVEEQTVDFVVQRLASALKGELFEGFVLNLLQCMGYRGRLTQTNTPGIDIIAHRDKLGLEQPIIKVQVKSTTGTVGNEDVENLYAKVGSEQFGLVVTLGDFSRHAQDLERTRSNLRLIGGTELVNLVFEHYEGLESRFRNIIPLTRIFVPQPPEDEA